MARFSRLGIRPVGIGPVGIRPGAVIRAASRALDSRMTLLGTMVGARRVPCGVRRSIPMGMARDLRIAPRGPTIGTRAVTGGTTEEARGMVLAARLGARDPGIGMATGTAAGTTIAISMAARIRASASRLARRAIRVGMELGGATATTGAMRDGVMIRIARAGGGSRRASGTIRGRTRGITRARRRLS